MITIDLGSNSLRVLVYECSTGETLFSSEKVVKTADGLAVHGTVNDAAVARVVATLKEVQSQVDFSSHSIRAVTTEAIRRASNAQAVLAKIEEETGVCFEIIDGEEEARLTLLAVKERLSRLSMQCQDFVLIDIGGGSTELIFYYGVKTVSRSFPVGIVTIAQTYETLEDIEKALPHEIQAMQRFCTEVYQKEGKVHTFVATAGTPTTVAAMKLGLKYDSYDADKINGISLKKEELDIYLDKLLGMPFTERERAVGTGRSDLIAAGILIYKILYSLLGFDTCVVIDDGLREGVALAACQEI